MLATNKNQVEEKHRIFIGRQPIFDGKLKVIGYELLFRSGDINLCDMNNGGSATSQVINNAFMEFDLDEIVGNNTPAYINFTRGLIINGVAEILPADRVVLEILETVNVDDELVDKITRLVKEGFKVALDDFTFSDSWAPLVEIAQMIKLDVREHSIEDIKFQMNCLQDSKVKIIAEKVETQEEFNLLKEQGVDYFQGYFFSKPDVMSHQSISPDNMSLLKIISQLQNPDTDINEIEKLISQNLSLSYKLFRYINSAAFSLTNKLTSVKQAIVYFGMQRLKNWICLIALAGNTKKPDELLQTGLVRAKMCELIAEESCDSEKDSYFIVGLFSILDALLDQTIEQVLKNLPLDNAINNALLTHEGKMGNALECCINCEQCFWKNINYPDISSEQISEIYQKAMIWARKSMSDIN